MSNGYGTEPFGVGPYGLGSPATANETSGIITRDPSNGSATGSRLIEKGTYVFDAAGRTVGTPNTRQLVTIALSTDRGSSAMTSLGNDLKAIDRVTSNFARRIDTEIRVTLAHLTSANLLSIDAISTQKEPGKPAYVLVRWRDLTTTEQYIEVVK